MKAGMLAALLFLFPGPLIAAEAPADNAELQKIRDADQADRQGSIDWSKLAPRDAARLQRVRAIIGEGNLRTAADYGNAALVFQHGDTVEDIRTAHALATLAMNMDPGDKKRRWLVAASWDRLLMNQSQPQWYGTQFKGDAKGMYLYPVAEDAVTDADRTAMTVPTLAESRKFVATAAKDSGMKVRDPAPTIEELHQETAAGKKAEK